MKQKFMKAAICTAYGKPELVTIANVATPKPNSKEILIKVMASTLNSGDVRMRGLKAEGLMKIIMRIVLGFSKPRKPILGVTFSGIVEAIGNEVSKFKIGDTVFGLTGFAFGAHAEYVCVSENATMTQMPNNASFEEAAALPFGAHTAIHFLQTAGIEKIKNPDVLIYGSTGAVGVSAVQIAQYYKANITAVCSSRGEELMQQLNVENVNFYDRTDFSASEKRYDIIFDAVGKISKNKVKHLLKPEGKFITVGGFAVAKEKVAQLELVKHLFEANNYKAVIDKTFTLDKIVDAHHYVDTERKKGNVVISITQSIS